MSGHPVRAYLLYIVSAVVLFGSHLVIANASNTQEWRFKVFLDDKSIGYHHFRLTPQGRYGHKLDINARFDVKFFFINAYSYRHENTEHWNKQCLKSMRSRTDDNGKESVVNGVARSDGFYVQRGSDTRTATACVMSFAYWDPAILNARQLLNAQTGELVDVNVAFIGREQIDVRGRKISANHYRLLSDDANIDLWYAADGNHWLALQSTTESGRKLRYLMI